MKSKQELNLMNFNNNTVHNNNSYYDEIKIDFKHNFKNYELVNYGYF